MGNMCSGCQRDMYEHRNMDSMRIRTSSKSGGGAFKQISDCIEEHRHYTEMLIDTNQSSNVKNSFHDTLSQQSEKPTRVGKKVSMNDFWQRHSKVQKKAFNLSSRPAVVYTIDPTLVTKLLTGSTMNQESHYYQIDVTRLMEAVQRIQRCYRKWKKAKKFGKEPPLFQSCAAVKANSGDMNSMTLGEDIDVSIWQA